MSHTEKINYISHRKHGKHRNVNYTHTDLTDLTDFYIPRNFLIFCPAERAERAEILLPCGLWDMLSRLRREPTELKCL